MADGWGRRHQRCCRLHVGWPLAPFGDRYLTREKDLILCSGHGALFAIADGACVAGPCSRGLTIWPVARVTVSEAVEPSALVTSMR